MVKVADLVTLARAAFSLPAWIAVSTGRNTRTAFWATLVGSTVLDWLDGVLGRRFGESPTRGRVDIEVDSWLTLSTALAAVRLRRLPWVSLVPPLARYALAPGTAADHLRWEKFVGRVQMAVLISALSPWRPPRPLAVGLAGLQLLVLVRVTVRRRARGSVVGLGPLRHPPDLE